MDSHFLHLYLYSFLFIIIACESLTCMGGHVRGMVHMWGTEDSLSVLLFTFLWVLQACMWSAFFTP